MSFARGNRISVVAFIPGRIEKIRCYPHFPVAFRLTNAETPAKESPFGHVLALELPQLSVYFMVKWIRPQGTVTDLMSHSRFHLDWKYVLRRAWLSLWNKHMLLAGSTRYRSLLNILTHSLKRVWIAIVWCVLNCVKQFRHTPLHRANAAMTCVWITRAYS